MTDLLEGAPEPELEYPTVEEGRQCEKVEDGVRCLNRLPADAHNTRLYCDLHKARDSGRKKKVSPNPDEKTPKSVTNNVTVKLPGPNQSKEAKIVIEGATALLNLIPLVLSMTGDEVCPPEIEKAIPAIAAQLGALSKFHPGLKKFFTPGESTGEMLAWVGLMLAVAPVLVIVMTHHGIISRELAEKLGAFVSLGALVNQGEDASGEK